MDNSDQSTNVYNHTQKVTITFFQSKLENSIQILLFVDDRHTRETDHLVGHRYERAVLYCCSMSDCLMKRHRQEFFK